jgi:hypothetical protein
MLFKVYDKQRKEYWSETFTLLDLAKSHRFPSNAEMFYEIVPAEAAQRDQAAIGVCPQCGAGLHEDHKPTCDYCRR